MSRVFLPVAMRALCGGEREVEVQGRRVADLIESLEQRFPGARARLCQDNRLKPGMAVVINGHASSLGLLATVSDTDEVHFVPALGGG
jgi:molybdopterin synthase sulfur carrier subunit